MATLAQHLKKAIQRLQNIDWEYADTYKPSHVVLIYEYLRRKVRFLEFSSAERPYRPFIRASTSLRSCLPKYVAENMEKISENIYKITSTFNVSGWNAVICMFYLEWAYLIDLKVPFVDQFPDLYDPMLKMFEGGGKIHLRKPEDGILCESFAWGNYKCDFSLEDFPFEDLQNLRDEALDEFDNTWYRRKILYEIKDHVKNAEEIADNIMNRLQKCSKYSKSIVFLIELAELLLNEGIHSTELKKINHDLEWFIIYDKIDHLKKKLPEIEVKNISMRISKLLIRLGATKFLYKLGIMDLE